jgi:hypothetical protein
VTSKETQATRINETPFLKQTTSKDVIRKENDINLCKLFKLMTLRID